MELNAYSVGYDGCIRKQRGLKSDTEQREVERAGRRIKDGR
jgi:hypothetical protein